MQQHQPATGDTRADGADRATDDIGCFLVRQADELGELERLALVGRQLQQQLLGRTELGGLVANGVARDPVDQLALPQPAAHMVGTDMPGDGEQPCLHRRVTPVGSGRAHGTQVGVLDEVFLFAGRAEHRAHPPHHRLGAHDELANSPVVALAGGVEQRAKRICGTHGDIMPTCDGDLQGVGNRIAMRDDFMSMQCEQWHEAISARADGEDPGVDERMIDAHLSHCVQCSAFAAAVEGSRRRLVVQPAPVMPDLSRRVAKSNAVLDRAGKWSIVRVLLIVVALEIIVLSVPQLVLGEGDSGAHDGRHLGSFSIAYAVALLVAAVRPARARTVLPVAAVLAGALFVTAVVDLAAGTIPLVSEASHLPELLSVLLVWLLAMPSPTRPARSSGTAAAGLRVVGADETRKAV